MLQLPSLYQYCDLTNTFTLSKLPYRDVSLDVKAHIFPGASTPVFGMEKTQKLYSEAETEGPKPEASLGYTGISRPA